MAQRGQAPSPKSPSQPQVGEQVAPRPSNASLSSQSLRILFHAQALCVSCLESHSLPRLPQSKFIFKNQPTAPTQGGSPASPSPGRGPSSLWALHALSLTTQVSLSCFSVHLPDPSACVESSQRSQSQLRGDSANRR